jgi:hypothetical protein
MPKRYRIVGGSGFHWEYSDEDDKDETKPGDLIAESAKIYATEQEAEDDIRDMGKGKEILRGRGRRAKPNRPKANA